MSPPSSPRHGPVTVQRRLSAAQAATRARLVAAAEELAASGGYEVAGVREAAAAAELSAATAYQYFGSRDELLVAVLDELERRSGAAAERRAAAGGAAAERVRGLFEDTMREVAQRPRLYQAVFTAWISSHAGEDGEALFGWHGAGESWIRRAMGSTAAPPTVIATLEYVLLGAMVAVITGQAAPDIHATLDGAVELLLPGG